MDKIGFYWCPNMDKLKIINLFTKCLLWLTIYVLNG